MSVCMSDNVRRVRFGGMSLLWHVVHGKIPSENGGGGTSTRSSGVAGWLGAACGGAFAPAAAGACATPREDTVQSTVARTAQTATAAVLRMDLAYDALHLPQPHRLEDLQPLTDHRGDVQAHRVSDPWMRGEVVQEVLAADGQHLGRERRRGLQRESVWGDESGPPE